MKKSSIFLKSLAAEEEKLDEQLNEMEEISKKFSGRNIQTVVKRLSLEI